MVKVFAAHNAPAEIDWTPLQEIAQRIVRRKRRTEKDGYGYHTFMAEAERLYDPKIHGARPLRYFRAAERVFVRACAEFTREI